jgi:hypothetical protein
VTRTSIEPWRLSLSSPVAEVWETIADDAAAESPLWGEALLRDPERDPVFSQLGPERFALGIETIYEGYLVHYGRPRLFRPADRDAALLLGDYLYAHGLVRVSEHEEAAAVADLAELISLCAHLRAEGAAGDGAGWAATAALLGQGALAQARSALREDFDPEPLLELAQAAAGTAEVERALAAHAMRLR